MTQQMILCRVLLTHLSSQLVELDSHQFSKGLLSRYSSSLPLPIDSIDSAMLAESYSSSAMYTTGETQYKDDSVSLHKLSKDLLSLPRITMYTTQRLSIQVTESDSSLGLSTAL